MALLLAKGAQPILDARMKGRRPADMVIIALAEPVNTDNPVVYALAGQRYDWRWVRDLDVCLYVSSEDDWPDLAKEVLLCRPAHMELWSHSEQWGAHLYLMPTEQDIAKPVRMWRYDLDFLPWMEFQNRDFIERRRYARDENGMPYGI